jgi:membrane protease YdiL (CAAX protease family)
MNSELRQATLAFISVVAAVTVLVRLDFEIAYLGHVGSALVAVTLLYTPVIVAWRRNEELATYGLVSAPLGKNLLLGIGVPLFIVFPLFALGYFAFYEVVCGTGLAELAPPGMCARYSGFGRLSAPVIDGALLQFALIQLIVVALPEELLFRGCLLHLLEQAIPPKRRILGGGIGWALLISALMFALIHIPKHGDLRDLATFFPGLLFGWMRSATGSILAPTVAHASSNVLVQVLDRMVMR